MSIETDRAAAVDSLAASARETIHTMRVESASDLEGLLTTVRHSNEKFRAGLTEMYERASDTGVNRAVCEARIKDSHLHEDAYCELITVLIRALDDSHQQTFMQAAAATMAVVEGLEVRGTEEPTLN